MHLTYAAAPDCPSEQAFVAEVRERTSLFEPVEGSEAERTFAVELAPTQMDTVVGRFTAAIASEKPAAREVEGATCPEVARALAFIVAMSVDPEAAAPQTSQAPAATHEAPPHPVERRGALQLAAGAGGSAVGGVAPEILPVLGVFLEARLERESVLSPSLRLGAHRGSSAHVEVGSAGSAAFTWTTGNLELCPARWALGAFALLPCARGDLGALQGEGASIAQPHDSTRFWLDLGAVARARWAPVGPLFLELEGGVLFPLWRDEFHFDAPDIGIHRAAPVSALAAADVGARFW